MYVCIWSNIIDIFSVHIFVLISTNHPTEVIISGWNWQLFPNNIDKYINFSDFELTLPQFFFPVATIAIYFMDTLISTKTQKKILYQHILKLRDQNVIAIKTEFRDLL